MRRRIAPSPGPRGAPGVEEKQLFRGWRASLDGEFRIDRHLRVAREVEAHGLPREFARLRILILSTFTIQNIEPMIRALCYLEGIAPEIRFVPPPQLEPGLLEVREPWDLVIVATEAPHLIPRLFEAGPDGGPDASELREELKDRLASLVALAHERTRGTVLVHNFVVPTDRAWGILEPKMAETPAEGVRNLNQFLDALSRRLPYLHVLDVERLASLHGKDSWHDPRFWHAGRLGLVKRPARMVVDEQLRFIRALRGRISKCLVLDCDNTLWGGTIGEDGIEGIRLGDDYPGVCYRELQREALSLFHRGVLLALNSRNSEEDVLEALEHHPAMLLRRSHLAAYRVNWQDKAANLVEIARELGLGLESLIYVDDDPAEVELINQTLPGVSTVCLGRMPSALLRRFRDGVRIDRLGVTDEDRGRPQRYQEQRHREEMRRSMGSLEEFYQQLQMRAAIRPLSAIDAARASQLSQRTNQFNLTTRRYSEADIARLCASDAHRLFGVSLEDKFGDYGSVGLLILARVARDTLEIDTFALSCRVIGRTLEQTLLAHVLEVARGLGCRKVRGRYLPTKRNALVADLYRRFGFTRIDREGRVWERGTTPALAPSPWIHLTVADAG